MDKGVCWWEAWGLWLSGVLACAAVGENATDAAALPRREIGDALLSSELSLMEMLTLYDHISDEKGISKA